MSAMPPEDPALEPRHPIQVVARHTGLSADVIRAWERRYSAVCPQRTATQRRLYSDADARRLLLLRRLTESGHRIGDLACLGTDALAALADGAVSQPASTVREPGPPPAPSSSSPLLDACLRAVRSLDGVAFERALAEASVQLSLPVLLEELIAPLLGVVGQRWREGPLRVAHEHFASAHLRSFLGCTLVCAAPRADGPGCVVATPSGQRHELGALMAAVVAASGGWSTLYLGADVPAEEIAFAARERGAVCVVLSICHPADDPGLPSELRRLADRIAPGTSVLVGGSAHSAYHRCIDEAGMRCLPSLSHLKAALDEMRAP
ncbi:MAG: cobalamin B12-binding domain-containing protein [Ectothiorhodospiraceae bacterium]|nr:cobalamin B12-binding domain-containing protein [Ectothiorhodospiraceae bacterium]